MINKEIQEKQKKNSKYRIELIKKATKQEVIFKDYLESLSIKFNFQKGFFKPFHRIADFYIKKYRLIVEIDGGYHETQDTISKDKQKDKLWSRFKTLRITNEQVDDGSYKDIFTRFIISITEPKTPKLKK